MASSLTSASLKSGFLFICFLGLIGLGVVYLLLWRQPSVVDNLNQQAFRLNYAAFKNGIKLANYQFIANQSLYQSSEILNRWNDGKSALDYNSSGFPIGTSVTDINQQQPNSALNCYEVWRFVLGPLQPEISIDPSQGKYWTELHPNEYCAYYPPNIKNLAIFYYFNQGNVHLYQDNSLIFMKKTKR